MASKNTTKEKRGNRLSYSAIAKREGLSKSTLTKHVSKKKIKGKQIGILVYFTEAQVFKMLEGIKRNNAGLHPRKISIIEFYLIGVKGRDIAKHLKMSVKLAYECIYEFSITGYVIVESKINNK